MSSTLIILISILAGGVVFGLLVRKKGANCLP